MNKQFKPKDVPRLQSFLASRLEKLSQVSTFNWMGYDWQVCMEGGRLIHPQHPHEWYSPDCVQIAENNVLCLSIKEQPNVIKYWDGTIYYPKIGVGTVRSEQSFGLGTFTAKIQLAKGCNLWPSFWLTGSESWPPEIDICESWSDKKGSYFTFTIPQFPWLVPSWDTTYNVHYNDIQGVHQSTGSRRVSWRKQRNSPDSKFIEYQVERHADFVIFRVNGKIIKTYGHDVCQFVGDAPMYVIFNLWTESLDYKYDSPMLIKEFKYEPLAGI